MKLRNSLLVIAIVFGLLFPVLTPAQPVLAAGLTFTPSATNCTTSDSVSNVNDGNTGTRLRCQSPLSTVVADLGALYTLTSMRFWHSWDEGEQLNSGYVEASANGTDYVIVTALSNPALDSWVTVDLTGFTARYVRVRSTDGGSFGWMAINEVEVYGSAASPTPLGLDYTIATSNCTTPDPLANVHDGNILARLRCQSPLSSVIAYLGGESTLDYLRFWHTVDEGEQLNNGYVEISDDGTTYTSVYTLSDPAVNEWVTIDLTGYNATFIRIRSTDSGSYGWQAINELEIYGTDPIVDVWQIGNYIQDGDMENSTAWDGTWWGKWTSSPWFSQSRPSSWTGTAGNSEPLCGSYFRQMRITDEVIIPSASQKFLWYGGDMYVSFGLRTQATVTGRAYLVDPFGRQIYLPPGGSEEEQLYGVQLSATDTEWQMFNMTLTDMPLGWYLLVIQAAGDLNGLMALDCVSISEGGYQQYVFNNPPLDEPLAPPPLVAHLETRTESTDPFVPNWTFTNKAAFVVGAAGSGQEVVGLFPGQVATVGTSPVAPGANLFDVARTTNWIEVLYNTPEQAAPLGFDLLSNFNIYFQAINISLQVSDAAARYMDVVQVENIETGATISLSDIEPGMESVDGTWTRVGYTLNLQPGRYRINVNNEYLTQTLYLSKLCVSGGLLTIENDWGCGSAFSSFQTPDEATLSAAEAQVTAVAAITQTAAYPLTSTAAARIMATQTAAVQQTRTALATANNATANAAATKTQIYALTATPAFAASATAWVGGFRATLTQRVALTQTQSALRSTQRAANTQTAAAQATQNARLTQTAAVQQTTVAQPNIYATMTAAAVATQLRAGELATNAYILTQQYDLQQTLIAQMTTTPDGTTAAQGTAIADLNATIAALATAQAAATAVTNPTAIPATAIALSMPPSQPLTTWDAECLRPDNPFNVSWWVDYERCMVLSWFAWGPSNTAQLQDLQTMAGGKEPIGTILQIGDAFENLLNSFAIFDWSLTGVTCSTSPPNATIFFEQAQGILNGELDLNAAYSTYSDEGNVPIDVIVGPYIARGIHFFLNILCALGIMQWVQWMADIVFTFLIIFYFKTRWIDPSFS